MHSRPFVGCRGLAPRSSAFQTDATLRLAHSPCQYPRSESNRRAPIESRRSLPLDDGGQRIARAHVRNCTETARVQAGSSTLELHGRGSGLEVFRFVRVSKPRVCSSYENFLRVGSIRVDETRAHVRSRTGFTPRTKRVLDHREAWARAHACQACGEQAARTLRAPEKVDRGGSRLQRKESNLRVAG